MTCRLFVVPVILVDRGPRGMSRGPKYFIDRQVVAPWSGMDYGREDIYLVGADVTDEQVTFLNGQLDVTTIPADLDAVLTSGQVTTARSKLEAVNIPGNWITTANTWREVVRVVGGLFQFAQRLDGLTGRNLWRGGTLATRWNQLPADLQADILSTCASLGYDTAFITPTMTMRVLLRNLAQQWGNKPLLLGCATI